MLKFFGAAILIRLPLHSSSVSSTFTFVTHGNFLGQPLDLSDWFFIPLRFTHVDQAKIIHLSRIPGKSDSRLVVPILSVPSAKILYFTRATYFKICSYELAYRASSLCKTNFTFCLYGWMPSRLRRWRGVFSKIIIKCSYL